jgi:hypothetical protein
MKDKPAYPFDPATMKAGVHTGLSRRELFAAMAMQGILSRTSMERGTLSQIAVSAADALIAELDKEM